MALRKVTLFFDKIDKMDKIDKIDKIDILQRDVAFSENESSRACKACDFLKH